MLPLLALSLSFTAGIWLASFIVRPMAVWLVLAGIGFFLLILNPLWDWLASRAGRWQRFLMERLPSWALRTWQGDTAPGGASPLSSGVLLVLCLVALCLGAARYQAAQPTFSEADLAWYNESSPGPELVGVAVEPPDVRDTHIQVLISAEQIILSDDSQREVSGRVLVYLPTGGEWHYGDRLRVSGQLQTPPAGEEFSYQAYLARQSVYSYMPYASAVLVERGGGNGFLRAVYAFRETGLQLIYRYLPDPEASLLAGIVLGVESGIPEDVDLAFKDTGTTHIIAISGFNITIVSALFAVLFGRVLGPRRGAVAAVAAISLYTVMVGADAAVVRAAIMGGLSLFAGQVGRRQHGLNSLGVTAGLMLLFNPMTLWDVGFQLSFAATLGLIVYAGPWEEGFESWLAGKINPQLARRLTGPVSEYVLLTLAAQLTTLPLIVYYFQRFSLVSLPANIAILPAQPPVMVLGGLAVLIGSVLSPVGQVLAYAVWPFTAFTIRAVEWFARWDGGVRVLGPVSPLAAAGFYLFLLLLTVFWDQIKELVKKNLRPVMVMGTLAVTAVLVWQAALSRPDGKLHLTMLDVGGGEAILIQTPEGRYVLIGGGESASDLSEGIGRSLPLFHRRLDVLVVAGTEANQLNALTAVLPRYVPAEVWWAGEHDTSRPARQVYAWAQAQSIPMQQVSLGQVLDLGSGVWLKAVGLAKHGAALRLSWGDFACLLPFAGLEDLAEDPDNAYLNQSLTALLLARGGETEANPPAWLAQARPQVALLSVDALDRSGLPDEETLQALAGIPLLRTDLNGSVELVTDGKQLWVYVEK